MSIFSLKLIFLLVGDKLLGLMALKIKEENIVQ